MKAFARITCLFFLFASAISYAQIPTQSLVGHYPFTGNANDASGNALHGTVTGATLTADRFGNSNSAYQFNGTSNYIALPAGSYTTNNIYSYSFWMKPISTGGMPICFGESSYGRCQALGYNVGGIIFAGSYNCCSNNPTQSYVTSGSVTANQWIHVVVTRDFTSIKLYVNGTQITPASTANTNNQNADYGNNTPIKAYIGARTLNNSFFNGAIDDVRIYSTAITQTAVTALYNESCFNPFPATSYSVCAGNSVAISAIPGASNTISWYSSLTSTTAIGSGSLFSTPVLSVPGTYSYFPAASSCSAYARPTVVVSVTPIPTISVNSGAICSGESFTLAPSGAFSYSYSSGSAVVTPSASASYSVIGASMEGCVSSNTAVSTITVNISPTITVNSGFVCQGESFTLSPSGAASYTFPGGSPVVTPSANTSYLITGSNNNGCTHTVISNVGVMANPVVSISGPAAVCAGASASLSASGANIYSWNTGSTGTIISVTPSVTTSYSVTGVNIFGCVGTAVKTLTVNNIPVISVNSGSVCSGRVFTITPSGANSYSYSSGSATVSPASNTSYTVTGFSAAGCVSQPVIANVTVVASPVLAVNSGSVCSGSSFTIVPSGASSYSYSGGSSVVTPASTANYTVTGANAAGCTASAVSAVVVNPLPAISISSPGSVCSGGNATLTASGASSYTWNTGALTPAIVVSPASNTTYFVAGTNSNGCTNSNFTGLAVSPLPTISVNSGTLCAGRSFTIVPSGALTYTYSSGSNIVSPTVNSSYSVTGTSAQGCISTNTAVSNVNVIAAPVISVNSGTVCAGGSFTLSPSGALSYTYSGGSPVVSPLSNTNYTVTGSNASGCTGSAIASVSVSQLPNLSISNPGAVCEGSSITLGVSGAASYTWSTGASTSTVTVSPISSTIYSVAASSTAGCIRTGTASVIVNPLPVITASSGSVCAGKSFTIVPGGASTYTFSGGSNIVTPAANTNYSVTGTSAQGCVSASAAIASVSVTPLPAIAVNSGSICAGNAFTITPTGASIYSYSGGSAVVSPVVNASYTVTGTSGAGCTNSAVATVTVNSLPAVSIVNPGPVCAGATASLSAGGASTYSWSTGALTSSISVSPSANAIYTVTGTSSNGCAKTATTLVTVNSLPVITVNSGTICSGRQFTIVPAGAATYTFSGGSNIVSPLTSSSYSVTGTSAQGCVSSNTAVSSITVQSLPVISVSSGAICAGGSFTMTPAGGVSYTYSGGSAVVSPATSTSYTVTGASSAGCTNTALATVTVNALPVLNIVSPGAICSGSAATVSVTGANSYSWNTGALSASINVSPSTSTVYSVTGTGTNGCIKTATTLLTVNPLPVISVNSGSVCSGNQFTLVASGAASYTYSGGSNLVAPASNTSYSVTGTSALGCVSSVAAIATVTVVSLPVITVNSGTICAGASFTLVPSGAASYTFSGGSAVVTPSSSTSYSVTGTSAAGCISSNAAVAGVTVMSLPAISISGNTFVCAGNSVSLTAAGANTYTWSTGSNVNTLVTSPTVNVTYSVTGLSAGGCANIQTVAVQVDPLPVIAVSGGSICAGGTFVIAPSGAATYTITGGSFTVSPGATTSYSVIGSSTAGCLATNAAVITVTVHALPTLSITAPAAICAGDVAQLTAAGAATYSWSGLGSGSTYTATPAASTIYTLTGTSAQGCSSSLSHSLNVNPLPTITVAGGAICPGNSFTLTPSGAVSYTYSGGSNIVTPVSTTAYSVSGTDGNGCVSASPAVATVSVVNTLTVSVSGASAICEGDTAIFTANGASTYSWSNGPLSNTIAVSPTSSTVYTVMGISGTCSNTAMHTLTVYPKPIISIVNGTICAGQTFTISPQGANNYSFSPAGPVVTPAQSSTYIVTGISGQGCLSQATPVSVLVNPLPSVSIVAPQTTLCLGETGELVASGAATYSWSTGASSAGIIISPLSTTVITVIGTDLNGCENSASVNITVDACAGLEALTDPAIGIDVYPNPNQGNFTIVLSGAGGTDCRLHIFDLQGRLVHNAALSSQADGTLVSSALMPGAYFARISMNGKLVASKKLIVTN